ncbi:cytochrome P450 [Ketobacter sp. MCCC 1A13808]|uniref:cytochrome P450 n=1 Tax=Ketobacter sp. MCCC 1A13808 TaxID=2602738 RepID=UPI000F1FEDCD|nr:cytochrome P450 [Ketobacter sp. MCCC 1A13808]MVF13829.1 cytochrome P450 [Ketobacter sp. MCCC 1A13808]RLP54881.1 MAG: cytochrome P450 [Ketobacter sp.]
MATAGLKAILPPSPKDMKLTQAFKMGHGIWQYLEKQHDAFGDYFTLMLPGQGPMVIISDPVAIKDIFSLKPEQYDASLVQIPMDVGEQNTVFLNKKEHQDSRKMVIPPLNTDRLKSRAGVMHEIVSEHINSWKPGDQFNVPRLIGDITLDVICYTVFNLRRGERKDQYQQIMLGWLLSACSDANFAVGALIGAKKYRAKLNKAYLKRTAKNDFGDGKKGLFPWKQAIDLKVQLADMIRQDIRTIRERNDSAETHMLAILARATDEDGNPLEEERVIAETIGLLVGGHETSAATAAWFMIWLLKKPDIVQRMRAEVKESLEKEAGFDPVKVAELPFLTACLNESQRLTPSAVGTIRWLTQDTHIGPLFLPKGSAVLPCTYLTQRRRDIFGEDAHEYRPDRWLEGGRFGPNEYFPFGGGRRACVGMSQARQQLRIIFAEFARRVEFDSEHSENDTWPIPRQIGGQTEPDGGVWVTVKSVRSEDTDMPGNDNPAMAVKQA